MKKKRRILGILLCICMCLIYGTPPVWAEEIVNPYTLTATPLTESGQFTVNVNIKQSCVMEAFKVEVSYNKELVEVLSGSNQYGYYLTFQKAYTLNGIGLVDYNHIEAERKLIFTGVQPELSLATMDHDTRCGYIQFQLKSAERTEEAYAAALKAISLQVKNFVNEKGDLVQEHAEVFKNPIFAVGGDSLTGETVLLGDVNVDGAVNLTDAQLVLQAALGIIGLDHVLEQADVNLSGSITLEDAQLVLRAALGITSLQ